MKNLPQASMLGTKMRSAPRSSCEWRRRSACQGREFGWGAMAGAARPKKRCHVERNEVESKHLQSRPFF